MSLKKYKLGELIQIENETNADGKYNLNDVCGLSTSKEFIDTKANMEGVSLKSYIFVKPDSFAYVPDTSRRGDKISLAYNTTEKIYLVSSISIVFSVALKNLLSSDYLFMFFNRTEFDRYARFHSCGSAREIFSWEDMCDIDIFLPPLEIQKKYVAIYKAMLENQKAYERGLDDLKLFCDGFIEDLRRKMPSEKIGKYIERCDVRNGINGTKNVMGISTSKQFREPTSKVNKNELTNYKVCKPRQFAFVKTTHNEKVFAYAFNDTRKNIVVSSVNEVLSVNENKLYPEYLSIFFNRTEFDRYARFNSWGSARETFTWNDLLDVSIPIPEIKIQQSIANIYKVYTERKRISERLKAQIKNICPVLIKGAMEEGEKE